MVNIKSESKLDEQSKIKSEAQELEAFARSLGAEIYGVASAEAFEEFPKKPQPSRFVPEAKSVIIVGMPFTPEIYETVAKPWLAGVTRKDSDGAALSEKAMRRPPAGLERYFTNDENAILTHEVGLIAYKMAWKLHKEGEQAFYFPGPFKQDPRFKTAAFQFTLAMYLAGLGQLGFNCSILTPEYGPRIWVTALITTKDLPAGQPIEPLYYEGCESCKECVKRCPSTALNGKGWKNVHQCAAYGCCGTCLSVCPVGSV
ncbi:MAG: epoxyqueuosine reductase [Deltaproteobacteria bacterium]|nr:epoxyqueuosine reductase [Deltaproteobacteria bacterium]